MMHPPVINDFLPEGWRDGGPYEDTIMYNGVIVATYDQHLTPYRWWWPAGGVQSGFFRGISTVYPRSDDTTIAKQICKVVLAANAAHKKHLLKFKLEQQAKERKANKERKALEDALEKQERLTASIIVEHVINQYLQKQQTSTQRFFTMVARNIRVFLTDIVVFLNPLGQKTRLLSTYFTKKADKR